MFGFDLIKWIRSVITYVLGPAFPQILCISLPNSQRRERMIRRFDKVDVKYDFVDAIGPNASFVSYYKGSFPSWYKDVKQYDLDIACYASHLKALRTMVDLDLAYAIICEDDIIFHKSFKYLVKRLLEKNWQPLTSLSFMISDMGMKSIKIDKGLYTFDPMVTWGGQMYLISREYAEEYLRNFDGPIKHKITSEHIIQRSGGFLHVPPLVLEDGIDSDRKTEDTPYHHYHFASWKGKRYYEYPSYYYGRITYKRFYRRMFKD